MSKEIDLKMETVSSGPGVYLMKNRSGKIIYVGKAKSLKKRLGNYFSKKNQTDPKTAALVRNIRDFETILTASDKEAMVLEASLIKKHRPRYNVVLKDDKRYPFIKIDMAIDYPFIERTRKIDDDGALYFGPFPSSHAVNQTIKFIDRHFTLRKCKTRQLKKRERPCLNYQMKTCSAPCVFPIDKEKYRENIREITMFLKGRTPELVRKIREDMLAAAEDENFEVAARLRDRLFAVEKTLEKQFAVTTDKMDRDVLVLRRSGSFVLVGVMLIKNGFLTATRYFEFKELVEDDDAVLSSFIKQYYRNAGLIPDEILVGSTVQDPELVMELLAELRGRKVPLFKPLRGDKVRLVDMAEKNTEKELSDRLLKLSEQQDLLKRMKEILQLERLPVRIECFDNSNISGTDAVSSMVVFRDGKPDKSCYRKYKIKTVEEHNDYGYMKEVLTRRFREHEEREELPDLLMVDGGKGQLGIAVEVLKSLGLYGDFDVVGLAKRDEKKGEVQDKVFKPGRSNPMQMSRQDKILYLLERVRDEAHRFAITFHRQRRGKGAVVSGLDGITGVGKKRKALLVKHFGSMEKIRRATMEELCSVPGISSGIAEEIRNRMSKP